MCTVRSILLKQLREIKSKNILRFISTEFNEHKYYFFHQLITECSSTETNKQKSTE